MRQFFRQIRAEPLDGIPTEVDARRHDAAVEVQFPATGQHDLLPGAVNDLGPVVDNLHAAPSHGVEIPGDLVHVAKPANHRVGKRTGDEVRRRFDQGDLDARIESIQVFGGGRAAETAADDDDLGARAGEHGRRGQACGA